MVVSSGVPHEYRPRSSRRGCACVLSSATAQAIESLMAPGRPRRIPEGAPADGHPRGARGSRPQARCYRSACGGLRGSNRSSLTLFPSSPARCSRFRSPSMPTTAHEERGQNGIRSSRILYGLLDQRKVACRRQHAIPSGGNDRLKTLRVSNTQLSAVRQIS